MNDDNPYRKYDLQNANRQRPGPPINLKEERGSGIPEAGHFIDGTRNHKVGSNRQGQSVRTFSSGATRDSEEGKLDPEGFLSPLVIQAYCEYMHRHRIQPDGQLRPSDNWQQGIPKEAYMKSGWRHFLDWWLGHRGHGSREGLVDALCGLLFNVMGYLFEVLKEGDSE
jgi:hypothetical protein